MFGGADQVQVFPFDLIHHSVHFREGHNALHHVAVDHEGGDDVSKTTVDHEVSGIGQDSLVQARNIAQQVVEAAAGDTTGGLEICAVELVDDVGVIGHLEIRHHRFAEPLDFYVIGVVRADGHGGVDDVGDGEQDGAHLFGQLSGFGGQALHLLCLGGDLRLDGFRLLLLAGILLGLSHQHTDLLGQLVPVGAQGFGFLLGLQALLIQVDHLVHQRELFVLELVLDVLLDHIGVIAYKFDV